MATGVDTVAAAPTAPRATSSDRAARPLRGPIDLIAALACVALAVVAQLTLPTLPGFDPFSWITWGHEIAHHIVGPHEPLILGGGPSWKPLPILFTTIFGFFGTHGLPLWSIFVRAVAFYSLYLAYVLGARLGASERWSLSGPVAGVLSVVAIMLLTELIRFTFRVTSEPLTVAAPLLWLDWHVRGRPLLALTAGTALALMRPEASVFVLLYALWYLWKLPRASGRLVIVAELVLIPAAWVVPPWIVTGDPNQSGSVAAGFTGNHGQDLYTVALQRGFSVLAWPAIAAAVIMVIIAARRRDWLPVGIAAVCVLYLAIVEVMTIVGYPGLTRFLLPAGALVCVLAGAGVAQLAALAGGGLLSAGVAALCVAIAVPFSGGRITAYGQDHALAAMAVRDYDAMVTAARRAGGVTRLLPCGTSALAVNHTAKTGLAWALQVPLTRIDPLTFQTSSLHRPVVAFLGRGNQDIGGAPGRLAPDLRGHQLLRERMWRVVRVTRPRDPSDACVGR